MDKIFLTIPKKSEYMSTIRLATSALSNLKRFNVDEIEDIKVIISEICTFFINYITKDNEPLSISYEISDNNLKIEVTDLNDGIINDESLSDMSIMIIESLSDNYNCDLINKKITFEKCIK